jgi:hypothetical protein
VTVLKRTRREKKTIGAMIGMYCKSRHGRRVDYCERCRCLLSYAEVKIDKCVFHESKPACNECRVHCYSREMREEIRAIMRFSGPRMLLFHPVLGTLHMVERLRHHGVGSPRRAGTE